MNNIEERRLVNDAAISDLTEEERNNPTEAILTNFLNKDWPKLEQFLRDNLGGMSHIIFNVNAGFDKKENGERDPGHCLFAVIGKANPNALFSATMASLEAAAKSMATLEQDCGEDYNVLKAGFYLVLVQQIIDTLINELGVEKEAIVMGVREVLHGDDFENAEPDENQVWQ